jgi:hypothetical protein
MRARRRLISRCRSCAKITSARSHDGCGKLVQVLARYVDVASHDAVEHGQHEYARYECERVIGANTVEGYYSIFKRGMKGVYQHCGEKHLHRYLAEFDFRYNTRIALGVNDETRAVRALKGVVGKRLTYKAADRSQASAA